MAYLTAPQVDTARAKSVDFGKATLYMLPDDTQSSGNPNPEAYSDCVAVFADKPFAIRIKPSGEWTECPKQQEVNCTKISDAVDEARIRRAAIDEVDDLAPHEIKCHCGKSGEFPWREHTNNCPRFQVGSMLEAMRR